MLQAEVTTWICTFCWVREQKKVVASVVGTFALEARDERNYDVKVRTYPAATFTPGVAEEVTYCACIVHEDSVVDGQIVKFHRGLTAITQAVALEVPQEPTDEPMEPGTAEDTPKADATPQGAPTAPQEPAPAPKPQGSKITTPPELQSVIDAAAAAKATKAATAAKSGDAPELKPVGGGDPKWFGEGYAPSTAQPKPEEREAMRRWFEDLEDMEKLRLTLKPWPKRGNVPSKIIEAYRWTAEYSDRFYRPTTV